MSLPLTALTQYATSIELSDHKILHILASHCINKDYCWPSEAKITAIYYSDPSPSRSRQKWISKRLRSLAETGYIVITKQGRQNVYELNRPKLEADKADLELSYSSYDNDGESKTPIVVVEDPHCRSSTTSIVVAELRTEEVLKREREKNIQGDLKDPGGDPQIPSRGEMTKKRIAQLGKLFSLEDAYRIYVEINSDLDLRPRTDREWTSFLADAEKMIASLPSAVTPLSVDDFLALYREWHCPSGPLDYRAEQSPLVYWEGRWQKFQPSDFELPLEADVEMRLEGAESKSETLLAS